MSNNKKCSACLLPIQNDEYLDCIKQSCNKRYHSTCITNTQLSTEEKQLWSCPDCQAAAKRGGDNSSTPIPVRASKQSEFITLRNKGSKSNSPISPLVQKTHNTASACEDSMLTLTQEIRLLRQTMTSFKSDLSNVVASLSRCQTQMDGFVSRLESSESRIKAIEERNIEQETTISQLKQQLQDQAQLLLRNEVELVGVEESMNENSFHIAMVVAQKIGMEIKETDLDEVVRVGPNRRRNNSKNDEEPNALGAPRPLVIRFTRKDLRDKFIQAGKARRILNSKDIIADGPARKVYINERLTREKRLLFREARRHANEAEFQFCWVKNGSILVRKQPRGTVIHIRSYEDLQRLRPSTYKTAEPPTSEEQQQE